LEGEPVEVTGKGCSRGGRLVSGLGAAAARLVPLLPGGAGFLRRELVGVAAAVRRDAAKARDLALPLGAHHSKAALGLSLAAAVAGSLLTFV
jgi:hypothetical protein